MAAAGVFGILAALLAKFLGVAIGQGQYIVVFCVGPLLAAVGYSLWGLRRMTASNGNGADGEV